MIDARLFQALSDPTRLDILSLLSDGAINVSGMVARLGCAQPAVSRHLRVLREAALIRDHRQGKEVEYSLVTETLAAAAEHLSKLAEARTPTSAPAERSAKQVEPRVKRTQRRRAAPSPSPADLRPRRSAPQPDFKAKEADFVVKPSEKSALDDFLL